MRKKNKKRNKSMIFIFFLLLSISIGFAIISRNLNIFGSSILKGQKFDVHFENVKVSDEGVQIDTPEITDKTTVEYNITLDKPGDFVEFTVDAKNGGTIDAMVSTFDGIKMHEGDSDTPLDTIPDYLDYSVSYANHKDIPIAKNHLLKSGEKVKYKIHVEYKREIKEEQIVSTQTKLTMEFNVGFTRADENAIALPKGPTMKNLGSNTPSEGYMPEGLEEYLWSVRTITFSDTIATPKDVPNFDISEAEDGSVIAYFVETTDKPPEEWFEDRVFYDLYIEGDGGLSAPVDSSYLFFLSPMLKSINRLDILDTSSVENMEFMFVTLGGNEPQDEYELELDLSNFDTSNVTNMNHMFSGCIGLKRLDLSNFDTSNVTNMSHMFNECYSLEEINLSGWDTSKVKNMSYMFYSAGSSTSTFKLDLSGWKTGNVINMEDMFTYVGRFATTFELDLSDWDTSNVTTMYGMFKYAGYDATSFKIKNLSKLDTSNVKNMGHMFYCTGYSATTFEFDLSSWKTGNVTGMYYMFYSVGYNATTWSIGDLSGWDTSNVDTMCNMFEYAGKNTTEWNVGNIGKWKTGNVTNIIDMFAYAGYNATTFKLDLSSWNTSNVPHMVSVFRGAGYNATTFELNLSGWDTSKVKYMNDNYYKYGMFQDAGYNSTTFKLDLSGWDVSHVTGMNYMFQNAGYSATTFEIKGLSNWDTSNTTDMNYTFENTGYNADYSLDLSSWNVAKVITHSNFSNGVTSKITPPNWVR